VVVIHTTLLSLINDPGRLLKHSNLPRQVVLIQGRSFIKIWAKIGRKWPIIKEVMAVLVNAMKSMYSRIKNIKTKPAIVHCHQSVFNSVNYSG